MKIRIEKAENLQQAFYVERDLEFGLFDWDIVLTEEKAKNYQFYRPASIKEIKRYFQSYQVAFDNVLVKEGIAYFLDDEKEYFVRVPKRRKKFQSLFTTRF